VTNPIPAVCRTLPDISAVADVARRLLELFEDERAEALGYRHGQATCNDG
jgi:hypothetical protein